MRSKLLKLLQILWLLIVVGTWLGTLLYRLSLGSALVTVACFGVLMGAFTLLCRRPYFGLSAATLVLLFFTGLSKFKEFFWKEKLFFTDFRLFLDPSNAETVLHYPLALLAFVLVTLVLLVIGVATFRAARPYPRVRIPAAAMVALGAALCVGAISAYQHTWLSMLPKGQNVPANLVMSISISYQNPAESITADSSAFVEARKSLPPSVVAAAAQKLPLPDIVILLQESTFNPALVKDVASGMPTLGMFAPRNRQVEGLLRVHTYGGGTWRSEFAALTGISSDDFGAAAGAIYYSAVFHLREALFSELNRYGYETYVLTPFNPASYNAESAYRAMGVKQIRQPQNYGYPAPFNKNLWHISTAEMMHYTKTLLETENSAGRPKAVFVLTMSEHGPYDKAEPNAPALVGEAGADVSHLANYTARLLNSDAAITDFEDWTRSDPKKRRLFVRFGDHQPAISYHNGYRTTLQNPSTLTYFALTDSQLSETQAYPVMDIVYLPGLILERLKGTPSAFFAANIDARRLLNGAYSDEQHSALLQSYRAYVFKELGAAAK